LDSIRIRVNQIGVRQRLLGGDIDPVRAKFLTIPAIAETYGHRAADFGNLKIVRGPFQMYTGRLVSLALVPADWTRDKSTPFSSAGVYFWLVRHVSQDPNPMSCRPPMKFSMPLYRRLTGSWQTNPEKINHHEFIFSPNFSSNAPTGSCRTRSSPMSPC